MLRTTSLIALSFRSSSHLSSPLQALFSPNRLIKLLTGTKMSISLEQLKVKSSQADVLIDKLRQQIEQIKLQTTPAFMSERAQTLKRENELLKKQVESLKVELSEVEAGNGGSAPASSAPAAASAPVAAPVAKKSEEPKPSKADATQQQSAKPAKQEKQQQQQQQPAKKKEEPKKSMSNNIY